ncbi:MAG: hypothetical protein QOH71_1449 [Blastocatellia bacterium]|nr:hypothetical protein [Blastocatellia bacterium]
MSIREHLLQQISRIADLRNLPFDNERYDEWRSKTGGVLDELFGHLDSEQHPCVQAFLSYRIPTHFTANRDDMQEFYSNILNYQSALLTMYLEDMEKSGRLISAASKGLVPNPAEE